MEEWNFIAMSQERIEIRQRSRADWNTMNNKSPKTWKRQIIPSFCNSPHILHHGHYLCLDDVVEVWGEGPGQPQDVSVLPLGVSQALDLGLQLQVHGPVGFACDESRKITCSNKLADAETILLLMMTDLKDGQLSYFFYIFSNDINFRAHFKTHHVFKNLKFLPSTC